ncbi:MAG: iron-containing alcohol dehydrogenase [Amphritea sp.]
MSILFLPKMMFYKCLMLVLKLLVKVLPQPKPTLLSGPGSSAQLCTMISHFKVKRVLIVTDAVLEQMGLLQSIQAALDEQGVDWRVFSGVTPDPTFSVVAAGLAEVEKHQCDALLAIGGGSAIDAAKVIALKVTNDRSIEKLAGILKAKRPGIPLFAIPTTAGTGSEVTPAAIVSDPHTHKKSLFLDPKVIPLAAALDPELMTGLPGHITAATGMDALTHAIESYLSTHATAETEFYSRAAVQMVFENLPLAYVQGDNLKAREAMSLASLYAGLAFSKANLGYVHAIAHQLGGVYQVPHGWANAIVLPYVLDYCQDKTAKRLAELARLIGCGSAADSDEALAQLFIDRVRQLNEQLGIPTEIDMLQRKDIPALAKAALKEAHYTYPVPKYMDRAQCEALIGKLMSDPVKAEAQVNANAA